MGSLCNVKCSYGRWWWQQFVQYMGAVIYCESGFQFKCFVRHVEINRCRCYSNGREVGELLGIREKGVFCSVPNVSCGVGIFPPEIP